MGISTFPNVASPIKSIQRGAAVAAGDITITAVVVSKTTVNSFSTASTGSVAASGTVAAATGASSGISFSASSASASGYGAGAGSALNFTVGVYTAPSPRYGGGGYSYGSIPYEGSSMYHTIAAMNTNGANLTMNSQAISGGTTNLIAGVNGAYLSNSTTLVVTGPCRYEVVEYY
jgi:hypothetical protein